MADGKQEERRFQVLTVVLAGVFGLVSAFGGGVSAALIANHQISAQRNEDRTQFLRQERREAYGAVIAVDSDLTFAQAKTVVGTVAKLTATPAELAQAAAGVRTIEKQIQRLFSSSATVQLVGSEKAREAVVKLMDAHRKYFKAVSNLVVALRAHGSASQKVFDRFSLTARALADAEGGFITVARDELGQNE